MEEFVEDAVGAPVPAAAAPAAEAVVFEGFVEEAVPAAAPPANGATDEDFFSSAAPAAAAAAPAAPPAQQPGVLAPNDPRIRWAEENRLALQQREAEEAAKKVEILAKAKEYLEGVGKARDVQLTQRRKANREAEAVAGVAEGAVPKGNTPWERVISVCNFNAEGLSKDPFKELSRYKTVLLAAKAANISVGA